MKMSRFLFRPLQTSCCHLMQRKTAVSHSSRTLLSPAYECNDQWAKRLEEPLIQQIELDKFFYEINQRFNKKQNVSAVDIDLFANAITRSDQLEELEHLLVKFRKTWKTRDTLESTHHAVIRNYLRYGKAESLLKLLEDRLWFGIFADEFCFNLLLDHFIEKGDHRNGTRVAILMAFQEDFSNQLVNRLAFLTISSYLQDADRKPLFETEASGEQEAEKAANEEEEEYEYVRVPYVRNPYFDDHFDIKNPQHLIGKSLFLLSQHLTDPTARDSARLIGLAMYEKWTQLTKELNKLDNNLPLAEVRLESIFDQSNEEASACLALFKSKAFKMETSLVDLANQLISDANQWETKDIEKMKSLYTTWAETRKETVREQMEQLLEQERWNEIEAKKRELKEKEEKLFFFENFDQVEMKYDQAKKRIEEHRAEMKTDEEYIPPRV